VNFSITLQQQHSFSNTTLIILDQNNTFYIKTKHLHLSKIFISDITFTESSATSDISSSLSLMHYSNNLIKTEASSSYLYNKSYFYKITIIIKLSIKSKSSISFLMNDSNSSR